jgi:hypothetical protein
VIAPGADGLGRLLVAAGTAAALVAAASAQGPPVDTVWNRRPAAAGAYEPVRELSGRIELSSLSARPNPRSLTAVCEARREAEAIARDTYQRQAAGLAHAKAGGDLIAYLWAQHAAAQTRAYTGDMAGATAHLRGALQRLAGTSGSAPGLAELQTHFEALIGVSELRRGELENCVHDRNPDRCIFPLKARGQHTHRSGAEAALAAFTRALARTPGDLELRWLLNVTAMTLGSYPDGLQAEARIAPERFASAQPFPALLDEAPDLGVDLRGRAGGAVLEDFDGDGRLDLAISSVDPCEPLHLFVQQADGRFHDAAGAAGLAEQLGGINLVQADYNNDGRPDLFVMRGGWELPIRNSLLLNTGNGQFRDVTSDAGLLDVPHRTHSAGWADYDNDGWLDLFVGHEETPSKLFRSNRDGTFRDVTRESGISVNAFTKAVAWGDYDRDGFADLYVSNYGQANVLYRNDGDGTFTDVTATAGVGGPIMSFASWFFDYDNDGWEDLFVAGFVPSVIEAAKHYLGERATGDTMRLYRNVEGRRFEDVTTAAGLDRVVLAMGANFGDLDNDGWLDFYLGTGAPSYAALVPNLLFHNDEGRRFVDVTTASGTGHLQKGHGVAFGDIDGDGDQDLYVNVGGFVPGDDYHRLLFRNPVTSAAWIRVRLKGVRTNRSGLGARVTVTVRTPAGQRTIPRVVTTGGSFGANPLALHAGLGDAVAVERLTVEWPATREVQVLTGVPLGVSIVVEEGKPGWTALR